MLMSDYLLVTSFWNEKGNIEGLMANIANQNKPPKHWVWIDDGSTDGGSEEIRVLADKFDLPITIYYPMEPKIKGDLLSIGKAWDKVLPDLKTLHKTDYLAVGTVDDRYPPQYFEYLVDYLDNHPTTGVVSGQAMGERRYKHMPQGGGKVIKWDVIDTIEKVWNLAPDTFFNIKAMGLGFEAEALWDLAVQVESAPTTPKVGRKLGYRLYYCGNSMITALFKTFSLRDIGVIKGYFESRGKEQCDDPDVRYYYSKRRIIKSVLTGRIW